MKLHLNITGKLTFILVMFGAALLGSLGALAYINGRAGLQQAATSELITRTIEKQAAVDNWIAVARTAIATLAESQVVAEQAAALLAAELGSPESSSAHDRLVREFQPHVDLNAEFTELFFIEAETGQVLVSTDPDEEGKFKENQTYFINGRNEPNVSEMYYSVALGRPAMTAAAPVKSADGRLLGVLAGRLDLDGFNTLINRRSGLRQTDDAYVVNAIGLLVTQPRFLPDPAIMQVTLETESVQRCLEGNSGVISAVDYRGVPALISYRWLPSEKICLIVKMDQAEAFASSLSFGRTLAWASGLALVLGAALAIVLARRFTRPILTLQTGAARIGGGEMDFRLPETSSDELGKLAREFNHMAETLQQRAAALSESERNYRSLVENTVVGVYKTNTTGEILYVNQALARMMGFDSAEEMRLGGVVTRYKHPETRQRLLDTLRQAGRAESFEAEVLTQQGQTKTILLSATLERDTLSGMVTDITERKRAEQALQVYAAKLEQSNRDLQEFAYVASHDLQEPLRKVQAFSDRLASKYGDALDEIGRDYLKRMHDASQRMQILINDLLGFSRVSTRAQPFTKVDLNSIAREVLSDLESRIERANARVEIGELPTVQADATQMHQLLQNLIGNALKFHHEERPPLIKMSARIERDTCHLSVEDNGIGFDTQYLDRIFKPFQRLHNREEYEGSGMGLAICRRIVERHGGSITATSTPGKGTTFLVTLPIHDTKETTDDPS